MATKTAHGCGVPVELCSDGDNEAALVKIAGHGTVYNCTCTQSTDNPPGPHGGTYNLKMVTTAATGSRWTMGTEDHLAKGVLYRMSAWVYIPSASTAIATARIRMSCNGVSYDSNQVTSQRDQWVLVTKLFVAPSSAGTWYVALLTTQTATAGEIVYWDDVSVQQFSGGGLAPPDVEVSGDVPVGETGTASAVVPEMVGAGAGRSGGDETWRGDVSAVVPGMVARNWVVRRGLRGAISAVVPELVAAYAATRGVGGYLRGVIPGLDVVVGVIQGFEGTLRAVIPAIVARVTGKSGNPWDLSDYEEGDSMYTILKGTTAVILTVEMRGVDGQPKTGLAHSAVTCAYMREGEASAATAVALVAGGAGVYGSGHWVEVDPGDMPGVYQLGLPNAALASGARSVGIRLSATGCFARTVQIRLVAVNPDDVVRGGMTGLPNAAAGAVGGVPVLSAGLEVAATVALGATAANLADLHGDVGTVLTNVGDLHTDVGTVLANLANVDGDVVALDAVADGIAVDLTALAGDVSALQTDMDTLLDTDLPAVQAVVDAIHVHVDALVASVAALEDLSAEDAGAGVLAAVVDTTRTVAQVLRRLDAFAGGAVTRSGTDPVLLAYKRETGATEMTHSIPAAGTSRSVS